MVQFVFNANDHKPSTGAAEAVPAGWYNVAVDKSELKPTKNKQGMRLELEFCILDGKYAGQKIFEGYNVQNPNEEAVRIAFADLSALCHAIGVLQTQDTSHLHNIPLKLKVAYEPESQETDAQGMPIPNGKVFPAKNRIKAYRNINEPVTTVGSEESEAAPAAPSWAGHQPAPVHAPAAPSTNTTWAAPPTGQAGQPWQQPAPAPAPAFVPPQQPAQVALPTAPAGVPSWASAPVPSVPAAAPVPAPAPATAPPWANGQTPGAATAPSNLPPWARKPA